MLRNYLVVTRNFDPTANEDVRVEHVQKGFRVDFDQIEMLAFMAFLERAHAVFCRRLAEQIEEPTLKALIERIALDEERHELFFTNLVRWCPQNDEAATVAAMARRAAALEPRCRYRGLPGKSARHHRPAFSVLSSYVR